MAERTSYAPGTPSWVDVAVPDTARAAEFYAGLFGWTAQMAPQPEAGGYGLFTVRGKRVAGLGPQPPNVPAAWSVYVTVADVDGTVAIAVANEGTVVAPPMDVLDAGRMAVLQDPLGAVISLWQPGTTIGAELVNEPNTFVWNELATAGLAHASAFYFAVFGWQQMEGPNQGTIFSLDGDMVCGAHTAADGERPGWSVWFAVDDCDHAVKLVRDLGGAVWMPPTEMGFGRGAVVADPGGAVFGIAKLAG
ncbi:MAG: VOC family protein [Actinobacteria bacterium]|nr:VOC family protein [Actinomycetota bacterium]